MTKKFFYACAGVFLLALAYHLGAGSADAQSPQPARAIVQGAGNGRYQIVNGTPEMARNIMLLDSVTGKTWQICGGNGAAGDEIASWCPMVRAGE